MSGERGSGEDCTSVPYECGLTLYWLHYIDVAMYRNCPTLMLHIAFPLGGCTSAMWYPDMLSLGQQYAEVHQSCSRTSCSNCEISLGLPVNMHVACKNVHYSDVGLS